MLLAPASGVYVDDSYPYEFGPLNVSTFTYSPSLRPLNPPVMRTKSILIQHDVTVYFFVFFTSVFAPVQPDEYAVFYFVTGLGGIIPGAFYDVICTFIASHGCDEIQHE